MASTLYAMMRCLNAAFCYDRNGNILQKDNSVASHKYTKGHYSATLKDEESGTGTNKPQQQQVENYGDSMENQQL